MHPEHFIERLTTWIGSGSSLFIHTAIFIVFFALSFSGILAWDLMFLILTTVVSLEAIYLAIFIQMTVNRQAAELAEVSEDVEDIQEDIESITDDVEEIQEDIEEISEDEEELHDHAATLETMIASVQQILADLEQMKKER